MDSFKIALCALAKTFGVLASIVLVPYAWYWGFNYVMFLIRGEWFKLDDSIGFSIVAFMAAFLGSCILAGICMLFGSFYSDCKWDAHIKRSEAEYEAYLRTLCP